jgi:hypothetical protein
MTAYQRFGLLVAILLAAGCAAQSSSAPELSSAEGAPQTDVTGVCYLGGKAYSVGAVVYVGIPERYQICQRTAGNAAGTLSWNDLELKARDAAR